MFLQLNSFFNRKERKAPLVVTGKCSWTVCLLLGVIECPTNAFHFITSKLTVFCFFHSVLIFFVNRNDIVFSNRCFVQSALRNAKKYTLPASKSGSVPNLLKQLLRAYKIGTSAYRINKFVTLPDFVSLKSFATSRRLAPAR